MPQQQQGDMQTADLDLIARSVEALAVWCEAHPQVRVHLNYPGIGNSLH